MLRVTPIAGLCRTEGIHSTSMVLGPRGSRKARLLGLWKRWQGLKRTTLERPAECSVRATLITMQIYHIYKHLQMFVWSLGRSERCTSQVPTLAAASGVHSVLA